MPNYIFILATTILALICTPALAQSNATDRTVGGQLDVRGQTKTLSEVASDERGKQQRDEQQKKRNGEGAYLGFGFFNGKGELAFTVSNVTVTEDHDTKGRYFHFGAVFDNGNRLQFSSGSIDFEFDAGVDEISGYDLDYFWVVQDHDIKPYLTIGLGFYDYEDTGEFFVSGDDLSGVSFNFGGGALINISDYLEFDLSYRMKTVNWQDIQVGGLTVETESDLDHLRLGLNLRFF